MRRLHSGIDDIGVVASGVSTRHCKIFLLLLIGAVVDVACIRKAEYDPASQGQSPIQLKYSINLSLGANLGIIGHMYLESVASGSGVKVYGWIEKNLANSKSDSLGENAEQVREYQLGKGFALNNSSDTYNGLTLPLRLQYLATERIEQINTMQKLVMQIENEEQRLLAIGTGLYKDFSKLAIAKNNDYSLSGLTAQRRIKFAGKRFSQSLATIKREIARRRDELATVTYDTNKLLAVHHNYSTNAPVRAYELLNDAASLQQLYTNERISPITPVFNPRGNAPTQRDYFESVVTQIAVIRQAKLQLASALCTIYEPFKANYYFSMGGVQEHLLLTIAHADDGKNSFARYKIIARGQNNKEFDFGYTDHDRSGQAVGMRLNLKPLGGAKGFSKLDLTLEQP